MKTAILFAGQGAQKPAMGQDLCPVSEAACRIFEEAGAEIKGWCFEGTAEQLRETEITQPAVYTVDMAAWAALQAILAGTDLEIGGMAGFSLGEFAALTAAGAIPDFQTGLRLVRARAAFMKAAGDPSAGGREGRMIAVFGHRDTIEDLVNRSREDGILEAVNFNSPIQTAVAGDPESLERFEASARSQRTLRLKVKRLSVSAAFHSPMMSPVVEKLEEALSHVALGAPQVPVYGNTTGKNILQGRDGEAGVDQWLRRVMSRQVASPVYWQETLESMWADGIRRFIEVGPGATLSGFVRKTLPDAVSLRVEDAATLEAVKAALGQSGSAG